MDDSIEIWAQDSKEKGLRVIRFKVEDEYRPGWLLWLGPLGEPDDDQKFYYGRKQLTDYSWERLE